MTKECRYCKTQIDTKATKCPNCHQWVAFGGKNGMAFHIAVSVLPFIFAYAGLNWYIKKDIAKKFGANEAKAVVISSIKKQSGNELSVIGEIRNDQKDKISSQTVQVVFYDKENNIVDTAEDILIGELNPGETRAYKISFGCHDSKIDFTNYDHFKLSVH